MKTRLLPASLALACAAPALFAQTTHTWTGLGGDNNWSTAANWDTPPASSPATVLYFTGNAPRLNPMVNDFPGTFTVDAILIDATTTVTLDGNAIEVRGRVEKHSSVNYEADYVYMNVPIHLPADITLDVTRDTESEYHFYFNGPFSGPGGIHRICSIPQVDRIHVHFQGATLPGGDMVMENGPVWLAPTAPVVRAASIFADTQPNGFLAIGGGHTFTLAGGVNAFKLYGAYGSHNSGGILDNTTLVIDGGVFTNLSSWADEAPEYIFGGGNAGLVATNGAKVKISSSTRLGRDDAGATNNTLVITGPATTWDNNGEPLRLEGNGTRVLLDDGATVTNVSGYVFFNNARLDILNGALLEHGGSIYPNNDNPSSHNQIHIAGAHPVTGRKATWAANSQILWGGGDSNTLTVAAGGRLLGHFRVGHQNGAGNSVHVTDGGEFIPSGSVWFYGHDGLMRFSGAGTLVDFDGGETVLADGIAYSNNTLLVEDRAVLTNANLYIGARYTGSQNETLVIRSGARVHGGVNLGGGGGNVDANSSNNLVHVTGEDSLLDLRGSEFWVGARNAAGMTGMCNTVRIDNHGVLTNAGIRVGYCYDIGFTSRDNTLLVEDGGRVFSSDDTYIGAHYLYEDRETWSRGNRAIVTGPGSLWEHAGRNLTVGHVQNVFPSCHVFGNELRAGSGGVVRGVSSLEAGSPREYSFSNRVTCAGGVISCATFTLYPENLLAADIGADGLPECSIDVTGTASFGADTFVVPSRAKNAPHGSWVLLRAADAFTQDSMDNLKLAPDADPACWKLTVTSREVILQSLTPRTLFMVR